MHAHVSTGEAEEEGGWGERERKENLMHAPCSIQSLTLGLVSQL